VNIQRTRHGFGISRNSRPASCAHDCTKEFLVEKVKEMQGEEKQEIEFIKWLEKEDRGEISKRYIDKES